MTAEPSRDERAVRDEAAHWFSVRRSGDMSAQDIAAFSTWLGSTPEAQCHLDRLQRHWSVLGLVSDDPAILEIREQDLRKFNRPARFKALAAIAAALVLAVTSTVTFVQYGATNGYWRPAGGELFRTSTGQRTTATLVDGSVVTLDAESELRVVEMAARRRLRLVRGHAFFQVAKDSAHPFIVEAAGKTIRAIGTKFDVRLDNDAELTVTLVEGKVEVEQPTGWSQPKRRADMVAGGRLVTRSNHDWNLAQVDTASDVSWLNGRLTFIREPLANAIAEVNRHSTRKIVFADGPVPNTSIIGVFAVGDADSFVTAMDLNGIARTLDRSETEIKVVRPVHDRMNTDIVRD